MNFIKKSWGVIKILLTLVVLGLFVLYFINNQQDFEAVFATSLWIVLLLLGLNSLHFFINGLFVLCLLKGFGHRISGMESFYISIISSFGNYFIPMQGGAAIRSVYLKKTLNFPYAHFIASLYGNYIVIFGVNALFALITLSLIHFRISAVPLPLFAFFGLMLIAMVILALVRFRVHLGEVGNSKVMRKILEVLSRILQGWEMISRKKTLLMGLVWITIGNFIVMTAIYALEFFTLGIQGNLLTILLYNCLAGVSLLISLTPGALGIREGIFFLTSDVLGISNEEIMQLALLDRGVTVLTLFFWFVVLSGRKYFSNRLQ
jgi:uncharacterized protein (TIRG00374 family)